MDLKDFTIDPMVGVMDTRTPEGELPFEHFRLVLNMDSSGLRRRCRMGGWTRFGSDSPVGFENQDLHDQLLGCLRYREGYSEELTDYYGLSYDYDYCAGPTLMRTGCREHITLIQEVISISKERRLIVGTKSRLYALNTFSGNWKVLADGLGGAYAADNCDCGYVRTKTAQIGNFVFFTNGIDPVLYWDIGGGPAVSGRAVCNQWTSDYVTELVALNILRANLLSQWQGFIFIADVVKEGDTLPSSIFWSDFNEPLSFIPGADSAAGFIDLGKGERVVAMEPIGGQFRVYTMRGKEKAIYEVALVGGDEIFNFREIYRGPDGVEFPNSLVNTGSKHYWIGDSGLFELGEYDRTPTRTEWMHLASGVIDKGLPAKWVTDFDGLSSFGPVNRSQCEQVVGGYDSRRRALWFSWPTQGSECNNMSLMFNLEYGGASLVDHGFDAFGMCRPDFTVSLRDFMVENGICPESALVEDKEGMPYGYGEVVYPEFPIYYIVNETENPDLPSHANSMCAMFDDVRLDDYCRICEGDSLFLMSSATDKCLKQFEPDQYVRERYTGDEVAYTCPYTGYGEYEDDGYYSLLQGGAFSYGARQEKLIRNLIVEYEAVTQADPNLLYCQIGWGAQPGCMTWSDTEPRELTCLTDKTAAQSARDNTRPNLKATFPVYRAGSFLAYRLYVTGTGGGAAFNVVTQKVRLKQGRWT